MMFSLQTFTLFHVVVSVAGIISGLVVAGSLAGGRRLGGWGAVFLVTTLATSVTVLALVKRVGGPWLRVYAAGVVAATYFNTFVLVVQLFRRLPDLTQLAPTQSEPPFAIVQALVLAIFVWLGVAADTGVRSAPARR